MAARTDTVSPPLESSAIQSRDWRFWLGMATDSTQLLVMATLLVLSLGVLPLYEPIWWWDIAMHTSCSAIIVLWLFRLRVTAGGALLVLLSVSVGWEVLEAVTPHFVLMAGDTVDTVGDIVSNTSGWALVVLARWWFEPFETSTGY
ncbi:hypothetical protein GJR99_12100 [Haloferax sp. MBLA0078]|uniref:VanZ-like domain-containing protein n=2 Tax=Haloferacaceae TaxID=1644056 RepID=A0A6A8G7P6_9EURY|nr:hypothetical protein Hfx1150_12140 [Haloferax sp. CBA1150]MRW97310.1 hypothetical protein [Haloferax marinum]